MRHKLKGRKLSRNTGHRNSLLKNLSSALILHESINTTVPKAKELKRYAEKIIHKAKTDSLHNRRLVISKIGSTDAYKKLFEDIGKRYQDRNGGYTRIIKIPSSKTKSKIKSFFRKGDGAAMARIELVEETKMNLQSQSSKPTDEKDRTEPIAINSDDNNSDDKK
jgi:large subunit ribosomal protein L17